jgi:hypothetical protein
MYNALVAELEKINKEEKKTKAKSKSLNESYDVTTMPVIGHIVTLEQGPYLPSTEYDVVAITTTKAGDKIYVTNQWYKEHKKIPQLVPAAFVKQYTPVVKEGEKEDHHKIEQNKPAPVVLGLG